MNVAVEGKSMSADCHRSYQCLHTQIQSRLVCTFTWLYAQDRTAVGQSTAVIKGTEFCDYLTEY